jgi:hypothetical protein
LLWRLLRQSEETLTIKCVLLLTACLVLVAPAWSGHTLTPQEQKVLKGWLAHHAEYRLATDEDCDCAGDIEQMKTGYGGLMKPVRDYHPYVVTGDFNGDGAEDFAAAVLDVSKKEKNFALVVFNGPFKSETRSPAFIESGMDLRYMGLFYGPPRPKPYRLLLGPFESDSGALLIPHGRGYKWDDSEEE